MLGPLRLGLRLAVEKVLRWCLHPRLRACCLRMLGAKIGTNVRIYEIMLINPLFGFGHLIIGDHSTVGPGTIIDLTGKIEIGQCTSISPGCVLMTHSDPGFQVGNKLCSIFPRSVSKIKIGDHVWIGANSTILPGVEIDDRTAIGAGSLVTRNIPSDVLAYGQPARVVRRLFEDDK